MNVTHFSTLQNILNLQHAITTREAGNIAYHVGDDAARVTQNRIQLARALSYDASTLIAAQQVHGAEVRVASASERGRGAFDWDAAIPETDALLTREKNLPLLIQVADCAPLLIVDSVLQVLCVVHAGWRGAVAGITSRAVQAMQQNFGTQAENVRAGIGPCLCVECLEIGEEVAQSVQSTCSENAECVARRTQWNKPHLDLRAMLHADLKRAKVLAEHIEILPACPRCDVARYFSHRGENGKAGRFGLIAWWQN